MKRLDPTTSKPFVRGTVREDGRIFHGYETNKAVSKCGYFYEIWLTPSSFVKQKKVKCEKQLAKNREKTREWRNMNPDKVCAQFAKRHASKLQRTPSWLTNDQLKDIADFYTIAKMFQMYTGEIYHVDHIVPLQGENVSGLHVPWNLQVLSATENMVKGNRHE